MPSANLLIYLWQMRMFQLRDSRLLLIASILCLLAAPVAEAKKEKKIDYKKMDAPMPPLRVVYPARAVYTDEKFSHDGNLFVMMFNPTCEHCEEMAMAISKNIALFSGSEIVLMATPGMGPFLEYFENNTGIKSTPQMKIGLDSAGFIDRTFTYQLLPQINVYSRNRKLLKSFSGLTTVDSLRPYLVK